MSNIEQLLNSNSEILIVSGEGERGTSEGYTGKRTLRAIKMRLTKEECGGDRWARAKIFSHESESGDVYIDIISGEYC